MVQKLRMPNILSNRATLYSVFFLSVVYLFFLLLNYDFPSVFFFGLVGLVSSFFTRNMLVILSIALIITIVLNMGGILGGSSLPPIPPTSETVTTTEIVVFDENAKDVIQTERYVEDVFELNKKLRHEASCSEPTEEDVLLIPGYQSSIMLSSDSPTLVFENAIETIPVDMESSYGYEFNNPFSKLGQKCGVSDQYSCFH